MRLLRAVYDNFGPHRHREVVFHPGLNCIKGPNGSGKSNILTGVVGALTNDFTRNPGNKAANVRYAIGSDERSVVVVEVEHDGVVATVERGLKPVSHRLTIGSDSWTKDGDVRAGLYNFLGVSDAILLDYVFVEQGKIFDFISARAESRAEAFSHLFGTTAAARIYDALGDVRVDAPLPPADPDQVRGRLASSRAELAAVRDALAGFADLPEAWSERDNEHAWLVAHFNRRRSLERDLEAARSELAERGKATGSLRRQLDELAAAREAASTRAAGLKEEADRAQSALQAWSAYRAVDRVSRQAVNKLVQARKEWADLLAPEVPDGYVTQAVATPIISRLTEEMRGLAVLVDNYRAGSGSSVCPECGHARTVSAEEFAAASSRRADVAERRDDMIRRSLASRDYDAAIRDYRNDERHMKARIEELERQLDDVPEVDPPGVDEAHCRRLIGDYQEACQADVAAARALAEAEADFGRLAGRLAALEGRFNAVSAELAEVGEVSEEAVRAAEEAITGTTRRIAERDRLAERERLVAAAVADAEAMMEACERAAKEAAVAADVATFMADVRAVFHRDRLPRMLARDHLREMHDEINQVMDEFDVGFVVEPTDDLRFNAVLRDGTVQPVDRLSWGQKTVFALAFRLVVNSLFAADLGLLCLDEPTAGLDEYSLSCLEKALSRMRRLSADRGLQVVVVTHERTLDNLFDNVIELA